MEIKLNCKKYLTKLNKKEALKNLFDFNLGSAVTEIVGMEMSIELKAFLLLFNTSRETNLQLCKAYGQEQINESYNLVSISKSFENDYKNFLEQNVVITKEFFSNILAHNNDYLVASFNLFKKFCHELNISLPDDIRITYYINYRENLLMEYQKSKESYQELEDYFNNSIGIQNDKIAHLLEGYHNLKKNFTGLLQQGSETMETLKDLYIEPLFSIHKNNLENTEENNGDFHLYSEATSINQFFNEFFLLGKKNKYLKDNYDMAFVLGQPGQGKTSFCYKLLYDYLENNNDIPQVPIVFQKIRDLVANDFINNPFETIQKYNPSINFTTDEFILVIDGLDEAYMSGGITDNDLRNLYDRLKKRFNRKIRIILTSRFNFLSVNDSCLDNTLVLQLNELTDEQIKEYCLKFKFFYPTNSLVNNIVNILSKKQYEHIKELLRQAVLIYFIAISDIEIEEKDSKSRIYDKIFDSLAQRSWDANGQLDYINPILKNNPDRYKNYLREYIRSIAFEIFHSPNLYITINHLLELDSTKLFIRRCFNNDFAQSKEKIKEISKYLLISFYFQQTSKENSDAALEFFHNSLWEFLTAEYIWEANKKILLSKDEYEDFQSVSKLDYFIFLDKMTGSKRISEYSITKNLVEIIEREKYNETEHVFDQLINVFTDISKTDFLYKYDGERCLLGPIQKSIEIFSLSWIFLHESNKGHKVINVNHNVSDMLFKKAYLFTKTICNVNFTDASIDLETRRMYKYVVINSHFKNSFYEFRIYESNFRDVIFENFHQYKSEIEDCFFENVKFDKGYIAEDNRIVDNNFNKVMFIDIRIPNESWYQNFLKNNKFDDKFKEQHKVEYKIEKNHKDEEVTNCYLTCKD